MIWNTIYERWQLGGEQPPRRMDMGGIVLILEAGDCRDKLEKFVSLGIRSNTKLYMFE